MYETQIAAGIEYLNHTHPGWIHRVDLTTLDMVHAGNCVLGQVLGGEPEAYWHSPAASWKWAADRGFATPNDSREEYKDLGLEWVKAIENLRNPRVYASS